MLKVLWVDGVVSFLEGEKMKERGFIFVAAPSSQEKFLFFNEAVPFF